MNEPQLVSDKCALRLQFLPEHPQHATHVLQKYKLAQITCFIGPSFPRKDLVSHAEEYGQYVLIFFRPWRELSAFCENPSETISWAQLLSDWFDLPQEATNSCPSWVQRMLSNIQCLHEGQDKRKQLRDENKSSRLNVIDPPMGNAHQTRDMLDGFEIPLEDEPGFLERERHNTDVSFVSWFFLFFNFIFDD